jgi:PAS domain S-box-containing protein
LSWLHFSQSSMLEGTASRLEDMRQAQIDLAKGFLYATVPPDPRSPVSRAEGLALLHQANGAFREALRETGRRDDARAAGFAARIATFERFLGKIGSAPAANPDDLLELRIGFADLEREADRVDYEMQRQMNALAAKADRTFTGALIGAVLALGLILLMIFNAARRQRRSLAALSDAQRALLNNREHLDRAQSAAGIGSVELDIATKRATWSDEMYHLLDLDPRTAEPGPEAFLAAMHPDDRDRLHEMIARALRGEVVPSSELRVPRKDGTLRWLERRASHVLGADGKPQVIIATFLDITDRKRLEDDLLNNREHLDRAQVLGHIGSCEIDLDSKRAYWSEEMYRVWDFEVGDGTPPSLEALLERVHPDDRPEFSEFNRRAVEGVPMPSVDFRIRRRDGTVRWINRQSVAVTRPGNGNDLLITNQDVTDRFESRHRLSEAQMLLAGIVESSDDAIVGKTLDGIVTTWNGAATRIFGYTEAEMLGQPIAVLAAPGREDEMADILARVRRGERIEHFETQRRHKSGRIVDISLTVSPIRNSAGTIIGASKILRDITEAKAAAARQAQLEAQLHRAQKLEAVGQLTGGIAHDFNNLLTVIVGRLEMLEDALSDRPELRDWVAACFRAANRGATLTRGLLSFSRQQPLKPSEIEVMSAIGDVIEMLPRTLGETIEVKAKVPSHLWRCVADASQLQNALLNLAINARDAMPEGGMLTIEAANVSIKDEAAARVADIGVGDYVCLSVSDTGTGMSVEIQARAFDPFFTTKGVGKGTGLGLSMVYGFARQSGGQATIYSEIGIGTTIRIYLPRSAAPVREVEKAGLDLPLLASGDQTVLLVEDDDDMRELVTMQLARLGFQVVPAGDGATALDAAAAHPEIGLVLTDQTLPGGMSGVDVVQQIKDSHPGSKTIYMSGYAEHSVRGRQALDPGTPLLQKPFGVGDLAALINTVLH